MAKIVNVYLVYDLDAWLSNPNSNFKFKKCLFDTTDIVKIVPKKSKYVFSGYRTTFDKTGFRSFDNGTARNVTIFGVDNRSSSHSDNQKDNL